MVEKDNSLVYENEDCRVIYNLWSEDGNMGFVFQNKTDKDLFLILPQTFFIKNGMSFDYYKNREYHKTENVAVSSVDGASSNIYNPWLGLYSSGAKQKGASMSIVVKENPKICIPPNSAKEISEYSVSGSLIRICNKKQAYPRRKSTPMAYSKKNSPLVFKNRIAYSFDNAGKNIKYVENEFWVSELINYSRKEAVSVEKYKECESDEEISRDVFNIASPHKFYNSYIRKIH